MAELLGTTPAAIIGRHFRDFLSTQEVDEVERAFASTTRSGRAIFRVNLRAVDERLVQAVFSVSAQVDAVGNPTGVLAVVSAVGQGKALERELYESQKMEAVGRLASGVAHELNNVLTGIRLNTQFVLNDAGLSKEAKDDIGEIQRATERVAVLAQKLNAVGRKQPLNPATHDANTIVREILSAMERVVGEDVELVTRAAPAPLWVKVDRGQLEQVLLNLIVNAKEAMPEGGVVSIIADAENFADPVLDPPAVPPVCVHRYAVIVVADTGAGMPSSTAERIFEPYFTTKASGRGLGLSTANGIVQQSGGDMAVETSPGLGTRVTIRLPLVQRPTLQDSGNGKPTRQTENGTILLVEDHDPMRTVARRVLQKMGYTVIEARDAADAFIKWDAAPEAPDLLISDIVMPSMSGVDLAAELRARKPGLKVLLMSGHAEDDSRAAEAAVTSAYLKKPFTAEALAHKVRDILIP